MNAPTVRLFQVCAYGWLLLYMVALLGLGEATWVSAPVPLFAATTGWRSQLQSSINGLSAHGCMMLCGLILLSCIALLRRHRMWLALIVWLLFRIIGHRAWLASNGGVQLMENMLLWAAFMGSKHVMVATTAFWIGRFQLLLVYAVTAAHKFIGHAWLDGSAVITVARDPDFHLGWLAGAPALCTAMTYALLAFMTLFPLAVWWSPSRKVFLIIGALFHLTTAIFMDIPQMGLAFIVCYVLWLKEREANGFWNGLIIAGIRRSWPRSSAARGATRT